MQEASRHVGRFMRSADSNLQYVGKVYLGYSYSSIIMGLLARNSVFEVSNSIRLKPVGPCCWSRICEVMSLAFFYWTKGNHVYSIRLCRMLHLIRVIIVLLQKLPLKFDCNLKYHAATLKLDTYIIHFIRLRKSIGLKWVHLIYLGEVF